MDDHYRGVERRRDGHAGQLSVAALAHFPVLVALQRIPVPALAIGSDGTILFANATFAEMLGQTPEAVLSLKFQQIFHMAAESDAVSAIRAHADQLVELAHADGWIVRAKMSRSALRGDDPVALVTFQDLTAELWSNGL
jgi:PAS domain S-box-containing protein